MITSPKMGLRIPQIGSDNDPAWEQQFVYSFNKIDTHTHDGVGAGAKIPFNNLDVTTTPYLGAPLTGITYLQLGQTAFASLQAPTGGQGFLQTDTTGSLYYISPTATIKLASASNTLSSNGFTGDYNLLGSGNGGAYFNNTSTANGAIAKTFYFYTQNANAGQPDAATHANIGAANAYLRLGSTAPAWSGSLTGPFVGFSNSTLNDTWYLGMLGTSLSESLFGLQATGGAAGYAGVSYPLSMYETAVSQTMATAPSGPSSKTWALRVNDVSQLAGATPEALGVRAVTTAVTGALATVYQLAQTVTTNGTINSPQAQFGSQYAFKAQSDNTTIGTNDGSLGATNQATLMAYWYGTVPATAGATGRWGGLRISAWGGGTRVGTGFDTAAFDGTHVATGLGIDLASASIPAGTNTTHIGGSGGIYAYASFLPATAATYDLGAGTSSWRSLLLSSTATASNFIPTAATTFVSGKGGVGLSNQIIAVSSVDGPTGTPLNYYNLPTGGVTASVYSLAFGSTLSNANYTVYATVTGTNPGICRVGSKSTTGFTVATYQVTPGSPANIVVANLPFDVTVIGTP